MGKYVPYLDCAYYFNTLEDCKKRIDKPHIAYVSREALRTFIREEFCDDWEIQRELINFVMILEVYGKTMFQIGDLGSW